MKQIQLAFAGVVALALSAQAGTSPWWSEDFSSYVDISALTNQVVGVRTAPDDWTTSEGDQSEIVVGAYSNEYASAYYASGDVDLTDVLKLNTEGNDLVFVPRVADGETSSKIVVDADIFFVGSDSAPTGFDDNGDVPLPEDSGCGRRGIRGKQRSLRLRLRRGSRVRRVDRTSRCGHRQLHLAPCPGRH